MNGDGYSDGTVRGDLIALTERWMNAQRMFHSAGDTDEWCKALQSCAGELRQIIAQRFRLLPNPTNEELSEMVDAEVEKRNRG